jgi:XFP N-terminal domain
MNRYGWLLESVFTINPLLSNCYRGVCDDHHSVRAVFRGEPPVGPLPVDEIEKMNAYWRACNYLSAGMIYLHDNPLLRSPLKPEHIKQRLLGHWGSDPSH